MQRSLSALCHCRNLCHFLSYLSDVERGSPLTFPRPAYRSATKESCGHVISEQKWPECFTQQPPSRWNFIYLSITVTSAHVSGRVLQHLRADVSNRMPGVVLRVSSCRHPTHQPSFFLRLRTVWVKAAAGADCMEHAEEVEMSAPLFDASVYTWRHEASQPLSRLTHSCPHKNS